MKDLSAWHLLHDGVIVGLVREGPHLRVMVEIPYLTHRLPEPTAHVVLELSHAHVEYTPYDEATRTDLAEIVRLEADIVTAKLEGDEVVVWGSAGELHLRYETLTLRLDTGAPLSVETLAETSKRYWEEWRSHHKIP